MELPRVRQCPWNASLARTDLPCGHTVVTLSGLGVTQAFETTVKSPEASLCCSSHMRRYFPPLASSRSWLPRSMIRLFSSARSNSGHSLARLGKRTIWCFQCHSNAIGEPMRGNHILQRNFSQILKRAGLPQIRFHDLRHTAASLLLIQGIHPRIVSEMLGHSTVSMTLDTDSHVLPDMQRDATAAFDRLFGED